MRRRATRPRRMTFWTVPKGTKPAFDLRDVRYEVLERLGVGR